MRTFLVLICSFALVCGAHGEEHKNPTTSAKTPQHVATHTEHPAGSSTHVQHQAPQHVASPEVHPAQVPAGGHPAQIGQPGHPQTATAVQPGARPLTKEQRAEVNAQDQGFRSAEQYRKWKETGQVERSGSVVTTRPPVGQHGVTAAGSGTAELHKGVRQFPSRHFNLANTPLPATQSVKFQPGSHIPESEKWRDSRYDVFRNYTATWHDADWWRSHHSRIVFVLGGWYYWHANYWYPAWGYSPEAVYPYDGPIYAFNDFDPDQAVANVQATLKQLGYYNGPINGLLDDATGLAIANYQRDHGLYATSTIDEPTLASLGMA
ncbi:MAG: peptidoglycan-binding domain-containing protein [Candidatus Udaeobacter sp.]